MKIILSKTYWIIILSITISIFLYCGQSVTFAQKMSHAVPSKIGFHNAVYDEGGKLLPWTNWSHALKLEMDWYLNCPVGENGYPVFIYTTFMDGNYKPYRADFIPSMQLGMGIINYLK